MVNEYQRFLVIEVVGIPTVDHAKSGLDQLLGRQSGSPGGPDSVIDDHPRRGLLGGRLHSPPLQEQVGDLRALGLEVLLIPHGHRLHGQRREVGMKPIGREGEAELKWVLLDYGDFVVHVFQPQEREFYRLERLWGEADRLTLPPEVANVTMAPVAPEADPADAE